MKFELIKTVSIHEHNERLYYEKLQDESKELSRRNMLKYLVIGSAGLLIPSYSNADMKLSVCSKIPDIRGKAACYLFIEALDIAKYAWTTYEMIDGIIALVNNKTTSTPSTIGFNLFNKRGVASSEHAKYEVPPDSYQVYRYGMEGATKVGKYSLSAENHSSYKELTGIRFNLKS